MTTEVMFAYAVLGAFAGVLAGLLGVGGGLVIVPVLAFLFQAQGIDQVVVVHLAIGTSLATIVVTGVSSVVVHHRHGAVLWRVVWLLTPGIVVGAGMGAELVHRLPTAALKIIFGLFELVVAVKIGMGLRPSSQHRLPGQTGMTGVGALIGFVSGTVGIGGGILTVPFLAWCNVSIRNAVATSAACGVPIALSGSIGFVVAGWAVAALPPLSTGYVYWPALIGVTMASMLTAPFGAKLTHRLPTTLLTRFFAVFLCALGIQMLLSAR